MRMELIAGSLMVICVMGIFLYQKSSSEATEENTANVVENGAKFTISLDKTEFNQGENIDIKLVTQNLTKISKWFAHGQTTGGLSKHLQV